MYLTQYNRVFKYQFCIQLLLKIMIIKYIFHPNELLYTKINQKSYENAIQYLTTKKKI
jgi:hypothetical protein